MADMIKFFKGLEASLPASGVNGALYITTDEGAIYLGTGTGMKRLGDFVQVTSVSALPEKAHESCLYYCVAENILAKWNGAEWTQINKQPTAEEMKTLLGLGTLAYKSEVAEGDLSADLLEKVNASAEGNHSHSNKGVLDGITAEKVAAWDAAEQNAKDYADDLDEAMNARVEALEGASATHATKDELAGVDAKFDDYTKTADLPTDLDDFTNNAGYAKTADVNTELDKKADKTQVAADIASAIAPLATTEALNGVKEIAEAARTESEVNSQIDAKITALNLGTTYEPIGAESRAKAYADQKFTDANLDQYTTEDEVKQIIDGVIKTATDKETLDSLVELVEYIDTHSGDAINMATAIGVLEGKVEGLEGKPACDITAKQIENWDTEVGAKALAQGVKDVVDANKATWDKAGTAVQSTDFESFKTANTQAIADAVAPKLDTTTYNTYVVDRQLTDTQINDAVAGVKAIAEAAATKEYTDAELAKKVDKDSYAADKATFATKTELGDVDAKFADYNTKVAQKAIDDAQDAEIAKKVAKTDYEADKATFATKTELNGVDAKFVNYKTAEAQKAIDDAQDAEIAKKADAETMTTELGKKVDKVDGKDLIATSEIERLATLKNYDDTALAGRVTTAEGKITALETASATHATKDEAKGYADAKDEAIEAAQKAADDLAAYVGTFTASEGVDTVVKYIDAKTANIASDETVGALADRVEQAEKDIDAIEADYLKAADKTELSDAIAAEKQRAEGIEGGLRTDINAIAADYLKAADKTALEGKITAEQERAEGIEAGLRTDVDTIKGDYLKTADKTALQEQITANANAITALTDGIDPDKIDGLTDLVNWANEHAPEVESIKNDIEANAKAIADQATSDAETYETKADATSKKSEIDGRLGALEGKVDVEKVSTAIATAKSEAIATAAEDAANKATVALAEAQQYADDKIDAAKEELQGEIAKKTTEAEVKTQIEAYGYATEGYADSAADVAQSAAEAKAAELDAALKLELMEELNGKADLTYVDDVKADLEAAIDHRAAADTVYTKDEVDALIAAAHTWGEF